MNKSKVNFEQAFERLEIILNKMNSGEMQLDESLALYEEANQLIQHCQTELKTAEKKVETLVKNRDQSLKVDQDGVAQTEKFEPAHEGSLPLN